MDDNKLGPLPEIGPLPQSNGWVLAYTADQMRAYGEACAAAERERCQAVILRWGDTHEPHETVNARNAASKIARACNRSSSGLRAGACPYNNDPTRKNDGHRSR